jgi:1,4-alpha-glucan branching enzyme
MIDLKEVGAFPSLSATGASSVRLGLYLPGIQQAAGFSVKARIVHAQDRFDPNIPAASFALSWLAGSALDLWSATIPLTPDPASHFGQPGMHLYRFELWWTPAGGQPQCISPWITDPFAREAELGRMSAFVLDPAATPFAWSDAAWKTPALDDLIVYEVQVEEFNDTFDGLIDRLNYLESLGVNCLELMPIAAMKLDFDWGYGPLHYFAPSWRLGGSAGLKRLVDAAHARQMAVILDVVYEHVDTFFPYFRVYDDLANTTGAPLASSPMIHGWNIYGFGPKPDFTRAFTQDYFLNANRHWLEEFHIDGFRYDEVSDLYVAPQDAGYRQLVHDTYQLSFSQPRFRDPVNGWSHIIQCAEALDKAPTVLRESLTNSAWQNGLLYLAESVAAGNPVTPDYAHQLDPSFMGYPSTTAAFDAQGRPLQMPVAPFQFLESHDHSQLICFTNPKADAGDPIPEGDRSRWFKLQPHAIALYTLQGIPMLWQGQEFADNYDLPDSGLSRVHLQRDTHWEYFYDSNGAPLVGLYRRLAQLRRTVSALRSRNSYFDWQQSLQGNQVLLYSRHALAEGTNPESWALILLNFGDGDATVQAPFPAAGVWQEQLNNSFRPAPLQQQIATAGDACSLQVPSNYGQVWVKIG